MFTNEDFDFLSNCSENAIMKAIMNDIIHKMIHVNNNGFAAKVKPQIIVTINGGAFQCANANTDIDLIIEDEDCTADGELFHSPLNTNTQKEFDEYLKSARRRTMKPKDVRIFFRDSANDFPFHLMIEGEIVQSFESMADALAHLQNIIGPGL